MSQMDSPLYLSRLILDPHCRQVRNELAHPYEMHRTLMHAFDRYPVKENEKKRNKYDVLFRADVDDRRGRVVVYVQSTAEPDWSYLVDNDGYLPAPETPVNPACKDVAPSYRRLLAGQALSFTLRANPTKRIWKPAKGDANLKGKRVALLREEEHIAWLIRKGHEREQGCPGGFEVLTKSMRRANGEMEQIAHVSAAPEGKHRGYKSDRWGDHEMTHMAVRFSGLLRITDADAFRGTIIRGIGSAKAFGFGLLSLAKGAPKPSAAACC